MRRFGSRTIVTMPAMTPLEPSRPPASAAGRGRGGSWRRRPSTRSADQRKVTPFAAKTIAGLVTASSRPPSAGPRNVPTLSSVLDATLAAVSSAGDVTSDGSSAAWAGRKTVPVALVIGTIGAVSVIKAVYIDKRELKCACVGGDSNVPLGFLSLTENVMMVAMAIWMIAAPAALSIAH